MRSSLLLLSLPLWPACGLSEADPTPTSPCIPDEGRITGARGLVPTDEGLWITSSDGIELQGCDGESLVAPFEVDPDDGARNLRILPRGEQLFAAWESPVAEGPGGTEPVVRWRVFDRASASLSPIEELDAEIGSFPALTATADGAVLAARTAAHDSDGFATLEGVARVAIDPAGSGAAPERLVPDGPTLIYGGPRIGWDGQRTIVAWEQADGVHVHDDTSWLLSPDSLGGPVLAASEHGTWLAWSWDHWYAAVPGGAPAALAERERVLSLALAALGDGRAAAAWLEGTVAATPPTLEIEALVVATLDETGQVTDEQRIPTGGTLSFGSDGLAVAPLSDGRLWVAWEGPTGMRWRTLTL